MPKKIRQSVKRKSKGNRVSNPSLVSVVQQIIRELDVVLAVVVCSSEMLRNQSADYDMEIALLLRRCASDRLYNQIKKLKTYFP